MEFRLKREKGRLVAGFADEDQNEGYAQYAAMKPAERVELVGYLHMEYLSAVLNLAELPRLRRDVCRVIDPHRADD